MENRTHAKSMVALTALALLSEQPRHPYEIQRLMRERHKDHAAGKTRALYHAMVELEHAGYIEPVETSREGRRPERTVYRITAEGHEELGNWLHDLLEKPVREWPVFSVAMSLIAYLPQERAEAALATRSVELRAAIAALEEALKALQEHLRLPRLVLLELEHTLALQRAELTWVLSLDDDMKSRRLVWNEEILRGWFGEMHDAEEAAKGEAHE
jgi:DNA-binding PadR family transcriptional regulator